MRHLDTLLIAFLVTALLAVALLPFQAERYARPMQERLRLVAEPGRSSITDIHVGLALQGSALHDFIESSDTLFVQRYQDARRRTDSAFAALAVLVPRLGGDVQRRFAELRGLEHEWRARAERFIATGVGPRLRDPLQESLYDELLIAAGRLDESIGNVARESRQRITEAERWERRITLIIAALALGAITGIAVLARRIRAMALEADLRTAQLQRALDSRSRLMRGITHDLKNPLGAIDGHAQLIAEGFRGPVTAEQLEGLARVRGGVRSLLGMINDLIEVSRLEGGQLAIVLRQVALEPVLRAALDEYRAAAEAAGHRLELHVAAPLPEVYTDAARIRQVLGNLLSNAIKFTPAGGHISVHACAGARGRPATPGIAIEVRDDGPGIPADQTEAIFAEFSRLEMHAGTPGTGLGLSIGRQIARMLGGDLTVTSEGHGATFTLWLPLDRRRTAE